MISRLWTQQFIALQPIPRPCSIEILYPREWQIAIPATLMRVDNVTWGPITEFQIAYYSNAAALVANQTQS